MSIGYQCDGPRCDTWQLAPDGVPDGWYRVTRPGTRDVQCCSADCLIKLYAEKPAALVVPWETP